MTDVHLVGDPLGLAFAATNAGLLAAYISLGHRVVISGQIVGSTVSRWGG